MGRVEMYIICTQVFFINNKKEPNGSFLDGGGKGNPLESLALNVPPLARCDISYLAVKASHSARSSLNP